MSSSDWASGRPGPEARLDMAPFHAHNKYDREC